MSCRGRVLFTVDDQLGLQDHIEEKYQDGDPVRELAYKNQRAKEKELISKYKVCDASRMAPYLHGLKGDVLAQDVVKYYDSPDVMKAASCVMNTVFTDEKLVEGNEKARQYLHSLRTIGKPGTYGTALIGGINQFDQKVVDSFVLKAPKDAQGSANSIHEAVVGFYGTNQLRKDIPNFSVVYGVISCSAPFLTTNGEMGTWCTDTKDPVSYVVYENVKDGVPLSTAINVTTTAETFVLYYLQFLLALRHAYTKIGFTHYDAHTGNIMVRKVSNEPFSIAYDTEKGKEYIDTNGNILQFIDYGTSHIEIKDEKGGVEHFGIADDSNEMEAYGVNRDRSNPMHDAYKLLCYMLRIVNGGEAYKKLAPLLAFFDSCRDPGTILIEQVETFYVVPLSEEKMPTLDEWIAYCRQYLGTVGVADPIRSKPRYPLSRCHTEVCPTFDQEMSNWGMDLSKPPTSVWSPSWLSTIDESFKRRSKALSERFPMAVPTVKDFVTLPAPEGSSPVGGVIEMLSMDFLAAAKSFYDSYIRAYDDLYRLTKTIEHLGLLSISKDKHNSCRIRKMIKNYTYIIAPLREDLRTVYDSFENQLIAIDTSDEYLDKRTRRWINTVRSLSDSAPDGSVYKWYWTDYVRLLKLKP